MNMKKLVIVEDGFEYDVEIDQYTTKWYFNDRFHRINGPAIEYADGDNQWFLNGVEYTKSNFYIALLNRKLITKEEAFLELI